MSRESYLLMWLTSIIAAFTACREIETVLPPEIEMEKTEFTVKPNRSVLIEPKVVNIDEKTVYSWTLNGRVIGTEKNLTFKEKELGIYYLIFKVVTEDGFDRKEIKVEVIDLVPPIISLDEPGDGFILETGEKHLFKPEIVNKEGLKMTWTIDKKVVSNENEYTFVADKEGVYFIHLAAENEDGEDEYLIQILVVKSYPPSIKFPFLEQSASLGRSIRIIPVMQSKKNVKFQWFVDGVEDIKQTGGEFIFRPTSIGKTTIKVVARKGENMSEGSLVINTVQPEQTYRQRFSGCKKEWNRVYEFLPAPGQFINEHYTVYTMQEACKYAEERLQTGSQYVSLGGFGGYIIVGFDHSIENKGEYDFAITGNSFNGSSEPGIVWVMQDENGNGLPDDNWYELKGSETGKPETIQDYEVTYFRTFIPKGNTQWIDNNGNKGTIDWLGFHLQPFYYPNWVKENSYTLRGTLLKSRTYDQSGNGTYWVNPSFDWGYADNFSPIDRLTGDDNYNAAPNSNHFKISNAITHDTKPIHLKYIDFIKVQTGLNTKAGWLGENSTEVFNFYDLHVK